MSHTLEKKHPQVLLLGNGLNIGHGGKSWTELMQLIKTNPAFPDNPHSPMPLQAIIATENKIGPALKSYRKEFYGGVKNEDACQYDRLGRLLTIGFDCILTTNYSYELECVAFGVETVSDTMLIHHQHFSAEDGGKRAETKYALHTYYEAEKDGFYNKIYHIHGEARKKDSMILGHYYYGSLLKKYFQVLEKREDVYLRSQKNGKIFPIRSWLDAFILGDVYILGFGYDFSEFDLWWLLNRKRREKADVGAVYFYEKPNEKTDTEKLELLRILNVNVENMGMGCSDSFDSFYQAAIDDIAKKASRV